MVAEIFRGTVDVGEGINIEEPKTYTVSRTADGKLFLKITWTRWRDSYGHRNLIGSGFEVHVGDDQVRKHLHPVLLDEFLDIVEPLPGVRV